MSRTWSRRGSGHTGAVLAPVARRRVVTVEDPIEPRPLDAASIVLVLVGAAAIIAGLTTLLPAWMIVVGIAAFAIGCALPLRTFWRRRSDGRRQVTR